MKRFYSLLSFFLLLTSCAFSQVARDYAVELGSDFSNGNLRITWPSDPAAQRYYIYSKEKESFNWTFRDSLNAGDSFYTDPTYFQGFKRDYWVQKKKATLTANGYIYAGYNINHITSPGILLMVIDSTYMHPLQSEIQRLQSDLANENWEVRTFVCQRNDSVQRIRNWVNSQWDSDSQRIGSLMLLGRVPVPYSGNFNPDAHPDHQGAWPADVYYVTPYLTWTDNTVNTTSGGRTENHNVPGDGKFDQDYIWPEMARIPMGRIDLYNMPAFGNDTALMKQYLDRNHTFRTGKIEAEERGLIDDNFGAFGGEAFAANGWRVFAPMFDSAVYERDYFSSMRDSSFLFSYGCGGGSYTSAGGIGNSANFVNDSLLNPFTMLFGSYFGDWDCANNFLRAPLASKGWTLTNAWAGRPLWMFQHAALNEPIGLASIQAQNAYPTYEAGYSGTYAHIALMGDPSLRMYTVAPLDSLQDTFTCASLKPTISWYAHGAETDSVEIWVKNGANWGLYNSFKAANGSFVLNKPAGSYELRAYAYYWERNPSGFFKVKSHPIEFTTEVKTAVVADVVIDDPNVCLGDTLNFLDNSTGPYASRKWFLNGQYFSSIADSFYVPPVDDLYVLRLELTDDLGCMYPDSAVFHAIDLEVVSKSITPMGAPPLCEGGNNNIQILWQLNKHVYDYQMDMGTATGFFQGSTGNSVAAETYTYPASGTFTITLMVTDAYGCTLTDTGSVFIGPKPLTPTIAPGSGTIGQAMKDFRSDYYPGWFYYWDVDPCTLIAGDSVHKATVDCPPASDVTYTVSLVVENEFGCLSDTGFAQITYTVGMEDVFASSLKVYPNPANDRVIIEGEEHIGQVWLYDAAGKCLLKDLSEGTTRKELDLAGLSEGVYILKAFSVGKWMTVKLVVEK